jgi:DNA-directed RNA polymerase specialized sigma24 family protein
VFDEKYEEENCISRQQRQRKKTRVRGVDFMRVEKPLSGQGLSPFELEVQRKIASVPSPIEELIAREEQRIKSSSEVWARRKLSILAHWARLSPLQKKCLFLTCVEGLSASEAAKNLNLARGTVLYMLHAVRRKMAAVVERRKLGRKLRKEIREKGSEDEKLFFHLYFQKCLPVNKVCEMAGRDRYWFRRIFRRLREKYENCEHFCPSRPKP